MKIGLFADSHYCRAEVRCASRFPSLSLVKIKEALEYFKQQEVALIICLGDLIDSDENDDYNTHNLNELGKIFRASEIEGLCCTGNHDAFIFNKQRFEYLSGMRAAPMSLIKEGKLLVLLDANFSSNGNYYGSGKESFDWTDSFIPKCQLDWLADTLSAFEGSEVYVFLHQNLDGAVEHNHIIKNAPCIREMLEKDGRVKAVYQGHYHPGAVNRYGNTDFITLKAMCEGHGNSFMIIDI